MTSEPWKNKLMGLREVQLYNYSSGGFIHQAFDVRVYAEVPLVLRGYLQTPEKRKQPS